MQASRFLPRATLLAALVVAALNSAQAATPASAPAAAATPTAPAVPIDAEKQKLIDRVLALWHPENAIIMMVQRPANDAIDKSHMVLQQNQLPEDKIDRTMKDIAVDVQKYVDTATPLARNSALKNMGPTLSPLLAQNFSNDELRQLIALLESPVKAKFEKVAPDLERAIALKVQNDAGPEVNKDILAMNAAVGTKLRAAMPAK